MKKIVLASLPRSGSTYLFRCIAGLEHKNTTPKDNYFFLNGFLCPYIEVNGYQLIKTHLNYDYWRGRLDGADKAIYLFSDPIDAVISTKLKRNDLTHFKNCGYEGVEKDIFKDDFLGYEKTFDSWMNEDTPGIKINYSSLWESLPEIEEYLGFEIRWNDWKPRTTNKGRVSKKELSQIESTYKSLIKKVSTFVE